MEFFDLEVPSWQRHATCADFDAVTALIGFEAAIDPDLFYPGKGSNGANVKKVCATCTVRQKCLDWIDQVEATTGNADPAVYGGETVKERRARRRGEEKKPERTQDSFKRPKIDRAARIATLERIDAEGGTIGDVFRALGVSRPALQRWCAKNGYRDLYHRLAEQSGHTRNQWTRKAAA